MPKVAENSKLSLEIWPSVFKLQKVVKIIATVQVAKIKVYIIRLTSKNKVYPPMALIQKPIIVIFLSNEAEQK